LKEQELVPVGTGVVVGSGVTVGSGVLVGTGVVVGSGGTTTGAVGLMVMEFEPGIALAVLLTPHTVYVLPTGTENVPLPETALAMFVLPERTVQPRIEFGPVTVTLYVAVVPLFAVWVAVTLTAVFLL